MAEKVLKFFMLHELNEEDNLFMDTARAKGSCCPLPFLLLDYHLIPRQNHSLAKGIVTSSLALGIDPFPGMTRSVKLLLKLKNTLPLYGKMKTKILLLFDATQIGKSYSMRCGL